MPAPMPRPYIGAMLLSALLAVLLIGGVNYIVDPYGIYRLIDRPGFNKLKPKAGVNSRLAKPYNVQRVRPQTLLLGNSRVESGIDPGSPQWPLSGQPVYNFALPASGIATALENLQYALAVATPRTVVLGLEFFDYLVEEEPNTANATSPGNSLASKELLSATSMTWYDAVYPMQKVKDLASTLFSLNALVDSTVTLAVQGSNEQPDLTDRGFNPMREYQRFARVDGYQTLFKQVGTTYFTNYVRGPKAIYSHGSTTSVELDQLRRLIALCRSSGINLLLYIHPYHAHIMEGYRMSGLWESFEEWKRAVVKIVAEDAAEHSARHPLELWDFSGYNEITTERIPTDSKRVQPMQWYWDPGHYKREVGELILTRLLGSGVREQSRSAPFGVSLTESNIDKQLRSIRVAQRHYADANREEIAALETLMQTIRARNNASVRRP